jgi:hypothetical protein
MTDGTTAVARREVTAVAQGGGFSGDETSWNTAQRIAKALASSGLVPKDYQNNIPNCLLALEYSHRLGVSVLAVMQNLDVIHGRPSLRATFLIGCANASGRYTPIRYRWSGEKGKDSWGCTAVANDRESGEECEGPTITIEMAKAEGWYNKSGSKWKSIPQLMLMYRAGSWWSRVYAPELSLGLHTTDELEDMSNVRYERVQGAARALDAGDDAPAGTEIDVENDPPSAVMEFVRDTMPFGGNASAKQRQEVREAAAEMFSAESEEFEKVCEFSEHADLGATQAEALLVLLRWVEAEA